ncbi:MAG: bis(5'-nucleosyl)-tetraphosphatase (symmetrical) YqeK [Phascolarctobacterium sp.]|nr:bis(5'-nucleosyl)-tetraphosphatase (symmetrical) YqeK [Phascolarctobacterium sp.]
MKINEMKDLLEASIPGKRFKHSVAVYETALKMAEHFNCDMEKVGIASLLHDCGREVATKESVAWAQAHDLPVDEIEANQPILLHSKIGMVIAKEKYGVSDLEILDAIRYHTTGTSGMTDIAKIVFLADIIEPNRDYPGVDDLRKASFKNLDKAMLMAYSNTTTYLFESELLVHPNCIKGYNELVLQAKKK